MKFVLMVIVVFSFGNNIGAKNVIIFGCDMSFSSHATNTANNIYVLGKYFVQGISTTGHTRIYAENCIKQILQNKTKILLYHCITMVIILINFLMVFNNYNLKQKNSEIQRNPLCLGNISPDFSITNSIKTGLYGNVYDFSVDYVPISSVGTIYVTHRYIMTKNNIV